MPSHDHPLYANNTGGLNNNTVKNGDNTAYDDFVADAVGDTGGGLSHNNMAPYFITNYIIQT